MFRPVPFRRLALSATLLAALGVPAASASASCFETGKTIKQGQTEAIALRADRDALLVDVEDAGDVWEDAAATRLFSADHAARANASRADYEALKDKLIGLEETLQTKVSRLNSDVANYNARCATRR